MTNIADLARRLSRKLEIGKGMQLTADDLALFAAIGGNDLIQTAAADEARLDDLPRLPPTCPDCDPFIYLIQAGESGHIKIGTAKNVESRRTGLQPSTSQQLHIRAQFRAPKWFELTLHRHFDPEHIRGEWFRPSPRILRFIGQING